MKIPLIYETVPFIDVAAKLVKQMLQAEVKTSNTSPSNQFSLKDEA